MTSPDAFGLTGRIIVLTGGAGLYGRGLARDLAARGATLVLASRNIAALEAVAREERAGGRTVEAIGYDQADESSILALRDEVLKRHGRIDGLVNNAVLRTMSGPDDTLARWEESMRVNATGLFAISRAFAEAMARGGRGSMVNVGSIQGMVGAQLSLYEGTKIPTVPDYFFHKGGMLNLTRYLAALYGPQGVRVNYVSPGGFYNGQDPVFVARYAKSTMLGRMARDGDLSGAIIFLLSDAAEYITGANLPVDGGYTAM